MDARLRAFREISSVASHEDLSRLKLFVELVGARVVKLDICKSIQSVFHAITEQYSERQAVSLLQAILNVIGEKTGKVATQLGSRKCDLDAWQANPAFVFGKFIVITLCNQVTDEQFNSLRDLVIQHISGVQFDELKTIEEMFGMLLRRQSISLDDISLLSSFFETLGMKDCVELVEEFCKQFKSIGQQTQHSENGFGFGFDKKIKSLQHQYDCLYQQLLYQINEKGVSNDDFLKAFSSVLLSIEKEYDTSLATILVKLESEEGDKITEHFVNLKPVLTFLNYRLLGHLIQKLGDTKLKQDMNSYVSEMNAFMKEATVSKMMIYLMDDDETHMHYATVKVTFKESVSVCTLERLSNFRIKFCEKVWQSEIMFRLKMLKLEEDSSFSATWLIPNVAIHKVMEAALNHIEPNFYEEEKVTILSLDDQKPLYIQVASAEMSAEQTISSLSKSLSAVVTSSSKLIPLNLLQQVCAHLDVLAALLPSYSNLGTPTTQSVIFQCTNVADLAEICHLQIKIISGFSSLADQKVHQYWYSKVLQSAYVCFRYLKLGKAIQVNKDYFYSLLSCTLECLTNIQQKEVFNVTLLLLFRITYACLSGLPIETLNIEKVIFAVIPYFNCDIEDVQVAALNAGQFLIPYIIDLKSARQFFILNEKSTVALICALGKSMPISSSLKLLHSYSLISENCSLFLVKGIALLSTSILVLSPRRIEKELAIHLLRNIFQGSTTRISKDSLAERISTVHEPEIEVSIVKDHCPELEITLHSLNQNLKKLLSNISLQQEQCTTTETLLKQLSLSKYEPSQLELTTNFLVQIAQRISKNLSMGSSSEQLNLASSLMFSVYEFFKESLPSVAGRKLSLLRECSNNIAAYIHTSTLTIHHEDKEQALFFLFKVIYVSIEFLGFAGSLTSEFVQDCTKIFAVSFSKDLRIISLTIVNKINPNSDHLKLSISTLDDSDTNAILCHLQKRSLLPASDLLCLLELASQYGKNFHHQNLIDVLKTLTINERDKVQAVIRNLQSERKLSIDELCSQIVGHLQHFRSVIIHADIHTREPFVNLRELLHELEQTASDLKYLLPLQVGQQVIILLLNAIEDILPAVTETSEIQHQRWGNFIVFSCWSLLKTLVKKSDCAVLLKLQAMSVIDIILQAITNFIRKGKPTEISLRTIDFCLGVIQDFLFDNICDQLETAELIGIKTTFLDVNALSVLPEFRFEIQLILAFFHVNEDDSLKQALILGQNFVADFIIPKLRSSKDGKELKLLLNKVKSLSNITENRQLLRKCGILPCLGTLLEQYADSDAEPILAELIYYLLTDEPDAVDIDEKDMDPIAMFEEFMTFVYEDKLQHEKHSATGVREILSVCSEEESTSCSEIITLHAKCLHGILVFTKDATKHVLNQPDRVLNISLLISAVENLRNLCVTYEQDINARDLRMCEKQIIYVSRDYFPELFTVSFRALQDVHSKSLSDVDRGVYVSVFFEYLNFLHFVIEQWSRMDGLQEILVECGAFYLLLNELHTASTTTILNEDIIYSVLTVLYNVTLNAQLALRFRIVITKQLLNQFITASSTALRFMAKFSFSCLHKLLSRSEMEKLALESTEVDMLARCLNRIDNFFGGFENLLLTLMNLACFPKNRAVFVNGGIVHILMSLAQTETGHTQMYALRTLMNMIPETSVAEVHNIKTSKSGKTKTITSKTTKIITESSAFMKFVRNFEPAGVNRDICQGIALLTMPLENPDIPAIDTLYKIERYVDCWKFCEIRLLAANLDTINRNEIKFYKARSMYLEYNRELPEMIEKSEGLPGFEYKNSMRTFCQKRILEVIKILTDLLNQYNGEVSDCNFITDYNYSEVEMMLDKALLDYLVFNMAEVQTCLLCHVVACKLVHSHYIPKSIIQEFVKAMGLEAGESVYIFSPTGHPSNWHFKSAAKLTFSMLCKTCDGEILSKDENSFKRFFFDRIYPSGDPESAKSVHAIPYDRYLFRFAAGLFFRNIAPLYSQVCAEAGNFRELHQMMQLCRSIILKQDYRGNSYVKFFLLALPSKMPDSIKTPGWDKFVTASLSPYLAYKLLQPGKPLIPKCLLCCMVKIGVLLFVAPFDNDLEMQLQTLSPQTLLQSDGNDSAILYIPNDDMRSACIPEKLWWSLLGWAKKEINASMSTALSIVPKAIKSKFPENLTHSSQLVNVMLASDQSLRASQTVTSNIVSDSKLQTVVANMLPPGFALNFNEHNTLPEKVIEIPAGHVVLLHQPFQTSKRAECFSVLCKLEKDTVVREKKEDQSVYSWSAKPYILIYLCQTGIGYKTAIKVGFYVNEANYNVEGVLPGCPPKMTDSPHLQEIIALIPTIVHSLLRSKGFLSMKSLLFWYASLKSVNKFQVRLPCTLDMRCWQKNCNYCDMRCDCCLKPFSKCYETLSIAKFGTVQSCCKECSTILFSTADGNRCKFQKIRENSEKFVPNEHAEFYRGKLSITSQTYPDLNALIVFSVCQSIDQEEKHNTHQILSAPCTKYIKLWQRSIEKPMCIEYTVDDQFNAIEMVHFQESKSTFSPGEERELMYQFHDMLVRFGIPYQLMQMETSSMHQK